MKTKMTLVHTPKKCPSCKGPMKEAHNSKFTGEKLELTSFKIYTCTKCLRRYEEEMWREQR